MILMEFSQSFDLNKNNDLALRVKSCWPENTPVWGIRAKGILIANIRNALGTSAREL
jgi:hypothetical protein